MSHLLWKYYWENDVERFRRLLAPAGASSQNISKSPVTTHIASFPGHSPGAVASSPRTGGKTKKGYGFSPGVAKTRDANANIGKSEVNSRDHAGLTILLRAASSVDPKAQEFVQALIDHPAVDLYVQDPESGWNALHRSLYSGNVSIARILLAKERANLTSVTATSANRVGQLIKTKDHEGNSPFDVYNSTIATRSLKKDDSNTIAESDSDAGESVNDTTESATRYGLVSSAAIEGDELFVFGSNKNLSLGVGDEDDRQYPERILLDRPESLLHRFHEAYNEFLGIDEPTTVSNVEDIPILARSQPLVIQDMIMSKLHTAILTTDPVSNLFVCGVGRGGRLGLGDENTQFKFVPVQGPLSDKKIWQVALGQNHTLAVAGNGELWTWGLNSDSQLGYVLPPPARADEDPMSLLPRQVFGSLKKEIIQGVAASSIHSVAHTGTSLYCWGRNAGQLALMDADSRSLDVQLTPRKVAASLLTAPIEMVSAIDKATTVLLANCSVWVFANYGYNLVKFPVPDVFSNHNLFATSFASRYDPARRDIRYITSGDDTIAALTGRGDLFTMQIINKVDAGQPGGSTTNPAKIKGAVTQPQCLWDSRKEGAVSVSVGEHGSVIICTDSGAVWRRVKRAKGKITGFADSPMAKRKDFKFQRVPYITNCVGVRSSTFGAFAAIRKDSKVMSNEIHVSDKSLWEDIGQLMCLNDFKSNTPLAEPKSARKAWEAAIARERPGSVPHELLYAADIETELSQWLQANSFQYQDLELDIRTSLSPDLKIPIHGWLLSARSVTLRNALSQVAFPGTQFCQDGLVIEVSEGRKVLTLLNADIFTVLSIVVFIYQDSIIPVWKYTREAPTFAPRFRQIRTEIMKLATKLQMPKLEAAARLQNSVEPSLNVDLREAIVDPVFFDDSDVLIQLDGEDVPAHSQLLCERCPFFEGMFHGRSRGEWLSSRRLGQEARDLVPVDLKHIRPDTFELVLEYLYSDAGEDIFEKIATTNLDEFSEIVLDVLGVANELMLDRLSEICQALLGRFVTTRNIAILLNEISPCAVTEFKDVGLEYICLQLENMLENCLLDGLDEDVLLELDEVVRKNQLARLPFVRSGRAELLLHEKYPDLMLDIEEERRRRTKEMAFRQSQREEERKLSSSYRFRIGSLDEMAMSPQTPDGIRRKSKAGRNEPFSPSLRPRESHGDMIFDMDDDSSKLAGQASPTVLSPELTAELSKLDIDDIPQLPGTWQRSKDKTPVDLSKSASQSPALGQSAIATPKLAGVSPLDSPQLRPKDKPWAASDLQTNKLDLKNIMSEASSKSALTASLAAQASKESNSNKSQIKVSQKERKRQMQKQAEAQAAAQDEKANIKPWEMVSGKVKPAPWKAATAPPKTSLHEAMSAEAQQRDAVLANAKPLVAAEASSQQAKRRTASPDTKFSGQGRSRGPATTPPTSDQNEKRPLVPHSKSYMTPARKSEPMVGSTMADIIGQQKREQELAKEAVAKRSLQEIQQEQAFQEWWDQESQRAQAEEARRNARVAGKEKDDGAGKRNRRGRGGGKSNKSKAGDVGDAAASKVPSGNPTGQQKAARGRARK